ADDRVLPTSEPPTVPTSSPSPATQRIVPAAVGDLELAYDSSGEPALMHLHDLDHNTRDGVHIASLAGAWLAAVAGLGGMRDHDGELSFGPRLPQALSRLSFRLAFRGRLLKVEVHHGHAVYTLLDGDPLAVGHHGEALRL